MFLELLNEEIEALSLVEEQLVDFLLDSCETEEDALVLKEEYELSDEEYSDLVESIVKRVSSDGKIRKTLSRKIRSRRASATTGRSKSSLRMSARKAQRTKRKNPKGQRIAKRKTRKALRKRKQFGIK